MKKSIETFKNIGPYELSNLKTDKPASFNGLVRINKYRITVELIEEPIEVLHERLQKLWDECDNHHQWTPLKNKAKEIGYELKGDAGNSIKR